MVIEEGGSVVDAAIVAALTAMCTEPGVCAPGGGGFLCIDLPDEDSVVIDGYMAFPGIGFEGETSTRSVTMTYGGGVTTHVDAGTVAVPGAIDAMALASDRYGVAPWGVLLGVVAEVIDDGFPLGSAAHRYLTFAGEPIFSQDEAIRNCLFDDRGLRDEGSLILAPDLAASLRLIGEQGARVFYEGDLAEMIVSDLGARGGMLTREDLACYRAVVREPLQVLLADWRFSLNPPPAVGGATVAVALTESEKVGRSGAMAWVDALITAFEVRHDVFETADGTGAAVSRALLGAGLRSPSTVSVAAADADGGAVAGTFSAGYGAGVIPKETGLMMNNSLGELELIPDDSDGEPGKRMLSNMAPTVGRRGADVVALGSPGADRITSAVFSTLASLADGLDLASAIDRPRAHPEFGEWGVRLAVEPGLDLTGSVYPIREFHERHMYFGGVNGAGLENGRLTAHADPRRVGAISVFG